MLWLIDLCACLVVRIIATLLGAVPATWALWCGRRIGDLMYAIKPTRVRVAEVNLRWAFGDRYTRTERLRLVREAFHTLGQTGVELMRLSTITAAYVDAHITVEGMEHLEAARARGKGIIFLTGHFGNWEMSSIVAAIKGYPMIVLAREQKLPRVYKLLVSYREAKGCRVVSKGMAIRRMVRELRENHIVGIVGDQGAKTRGERVSLFGRDALSPVGPVELAMRTQATVLPVFIRRRRGPQHTITINPALDLAPRAAEGMRDTVRRGMTEFLGRLESHVQRYPGQWLWMHKRWKSTTRRHAVVLSDGKPGHVKQSLAVVEAIKRMHPTLTHDVVEVTYRSPWRRTLVALAARWSWGHAERWLQWTLCQGQDMLNIPCDYVISCGASVAPINVLLTRESAARSVVVMRPALIPPRCFDLALIPAHDRPAAHAHVVLTHGALTAITPARLAAARTVLLKRHRLPKTNGHIIGVLWGGNTDDMRWQRYSVEQLLTGLESVCRTHGSQLMMTTSRRTSADVEELCAQRLHTQVWCPLLVLANRANAHGTVEGILGAARVVVVSGESSSMIAEAVASGRPVVVVTPEPRERRTLAPKRQALLDTLADTPQVIVTTPQGCADAVRAVWDHANVPATTEWQKLCNAVTRLR